MTPSRKIRLTNYASCAGWAGKLPMGALAQVLRSLPAVTDPNLLVGADHFDDAGVYKIDDDKALVLTLDFFPPLVDDPYEYGRIAAANSLSDVYSMGGKPLSVLNIVGFPDDKLPLEILGEILRGGAERVTAAGAVVAGGHSVRDSEIKFGLSVTGLVHPDRIMTNGGAKVGDVLVLTKPIGSGVLTSAAKMEIISQADLQEAIDVMTDLNAGTAQAIADVAADFGDDPQAAGIHAVTDITGFGLIGHAHEMAQASGVTIKIEAATVPLLENTLALAKKKMLTRAYKSNLEHLGDNFEVRSGGGGIGKSGESGTAGSSGRAGYARRNGPIDDTLVHVLADAQTSGGLLIAVTPNRADALLSALKTHNTRCAVVIAEIMDRSERTVTLR